MALGWLVEAEKLGLAEPAGCATVDQAPVTPVAGVLPAKTKLVLPVGTQASGPALASDGPGSPLVVICTLLTDVRQPPVLVLGVATTVQAKT